MIGLPGAGKTTYIKEIIEKKGITDYSIISRDLIRVKLGQCKEGEKYLGTSEEEEAVTEEFNRELMAAVKKGSTIFLDNMNTRRKYRDTYKNLLKGHKFRWVYVYVQAPNIDDNIERRKGQIPEESFKPMISRLEWPSASEYNELIIKITNDNGKV
jgi:predicted kinase